MPLMNWTNDLSVGVPSIDDEHKKLVGMLNELYDAMHAGHAKDVLSKILDDMIAYTAAHFKHEEELFKRTGYPHAAAHKAEHDALTKQVLAVREKYAQARTTQLSMEVMTFLKSWLNGHIRESDMDYAEHFIAKGVR